MAHPTSPTPALDEQHPFDPATGKYQVHCTVCGNYTEDSDAPPALDYLCGPCEAKDE